MNLSVAADFLKPIRHAGLGTPIVIVLMMAMVVLPLPAFLLDLLFTFNIALSLIVLLVVVYTHRPLDFAIFPSIILITTLFRLSLNVASTRVVLLEGHKGGDAAGKVIQAFGEVVIGGNYAVGLVVFAILVIINFAVVTKGAGRVSEVSARFILDAMPGKQMAIDADLNSGLVTQEEARNRRAEISKEADFYGSMDGASKFVRGDAIAGILILFINIIGGLTIGMVQHDLSMADASGFYVLLTIGDGLVAQIPALLLSTASAVIVTRVTSSDLNMGEQISNQFLENPKALAVSASVVGLLGLMPGMPHLPFLLLAGTLGSAAYFIARRTVVETLVEKEKSAPAPSSEPKDLSWDDVTPIDMIGLEVGYRLIPLVDKNQGGQLMSRIRGVRKKLSQELGFLVPSVHIRDNLDLNPNAYRISLAGVTIGESDVMPEQEMAINPGRVFGTLQGIECKDPAFGLEAVWIDPTQKDHAQTLGYTVVDSSTVVATHLSQLLQNHAHDLFGHEEAQQLLDILSKTAPKLVEDLVPTLLPLNVVVKVLQNLLQERVSIRDIRSIAETLAEYGAKSQDPDTLTAFVRGSLGRSIVQKISGLATEMSVMTLDPELEQLLLQSLKTTTEDGVGIEPGLAEQIHTSLKDNTQKMEIEGNSAILLVPSTLRTWLARFVRHTITSLHVLSYNEIPEDQQVKVVSTIGHTA